MLAFTLIAVTPAAGTSWFVPGGNLPFGLSGVGAVPGRNYTPIMTTDPVDLDGVKLVPYIDGDRWCTAVPALENGETYTLVSSTSGISGRLSGWSGPLDDGDVEKDVRPMGRGCLNPVASFAIHNYESGPLQRVTATVVDASPLPVTGMRFHASPDTMQTNEPVLLTATAEVSSGTASGVISVTDQFPDDDAVACPIRHVVVTAQDPATVTCLTTYSASDPMPLGWWTAPITATFTPDDPKSVVGSYTFGAVYTHLGTTTTGLTFRKGPVAVATVRPQFAGPFRPTGVVSFYERGAPLPPCLSQPLRNRGTPVATCPLTGLTTGARGITALYTGDANFRSSRSDPYAVRIAPR